MNQGDAPRIHHLEVLRTARYALAGGPGGTPKELWVVLHGYRQLASRFLRRFHGLAGPDRWIVAPEALNRFYLDDGPGRHGPDAPVGATWMTREDRGAEIRDYVRYLDRLLDHLVQGLESAPALGVLGFSQGVHTAARWVTLGGARPVRTVLWGADLPEDLDPERAAAALGATDLVLVQGRADPHRRVAVEAKQDEKFRAMGLRPRRVDHEGGHDLDRAVLEPLLRIRR